MIRFIILIFLVCLTQIDLPPAFAQASKQMGDPIVIEVIQLDHADAQQLAAVLAPFLSKEGSIVPYSPTNSLIIKDRKSRVEKLVRIIKGNFYPFPY